MKWPTSGAGSLLSGERGDEWTCEEGGAFAPVEFYVWLFEHDVGITPCAEHLIAGGVSLNDCEDDLIGFFEFSLDESQMVQTFLFEGSSRLITKHLGGTCGYVPPGEVKGCSGFGSGPEYDFRFRITRVADARTGVVAPTEPNPSPRTAPSPTDRPATTPLAPVEATPTPARKTSSPRR